MPEAVRRWLGWLITAVALGVIVIGLAAGEETPGDRVEALAAEIKCPVCPTESVADSTTQIARDIKAEIEQLIAAGRSDGEIRDLYAARYGDQILLDPPPRGRNLILWALPAAALILGVAAVAGRVRPRSSTGSE